MMESQKQKAEIIWRRPQIEDNLKKDDNPKNTDGTKMGGPLDEDNLQMKINPKMRTIW